MDISVFGLGYVGSVTGAGLAELGHTVVGVDVKEDKVRSVMDGRSPVAEPGLEAAIGRAREEGRLRATTDAAEAVAASEVALVCVGTPSRADGTQDAAALGRVCEEIGRCLAQAGRSEYVVAIRSTTTPGTIADVVLPALRRHVDEASAVRAVANPEFMREGSALADFHDPPFVLLGGEAEACATVRRIYADVEAPVLEVGLREAEAVKLVSNTFHALKVSFANEVGNVCAELGVDGQTVMDVFCRDRRLNISPKYLSPGFAFGGSCLPKDLRALVAAARQVGVESPVLSSIERSNEEQIRRAFRRVEAAGSRRVALLGLVFKPGTDDLRESPYVSLAEILLGKGYDLRIFDPWLDLDALVGTNREFIEDSIPHLARLLEDSALEAVEASDVVLVAHSHEAFEEALRGASGREVIRLDRPLALGAEEDRIPLWSNARRATVG